MSSLFFIAILSMVVIYADLKMIKGEGGITGEPFAATWNGLGSIIWILQGKSRQPMQYRVLIPWICGFLGRDNMFGPGTEKYAYFNIYIRMRWITIVGAITGSFFYFAQLGIDPYFGSLLLSVFFIMAALYDYTDVYIEIGLLSLYLILSNQPTTIDLFVLPVLVFVATLNRETAVVMPLITALSGEWLLSGGSFLGFAAGYYLPRKFYGKRERYCSLNMFPENLKRLAFGYKYTNLPIVYNEYTHFFVLFLLSAVVYVMAFLDGGIYPAEIVLGLLAIALFIPTVWREIRVFAPTMLAVIPMGFRLWM